MTDKFKKVTKDEYDTFVQGYPRELVGDVAGMFEPPLLTMNDFTIAPNWPDGVVAKTIMWENSYPNPDGSKRTNEYFILTQ